MEFSYFSSDTIAAIATSLAGDGGVGIIRVSGPNALVASQKIISGLENPVPRYLHRITVFERSLSENKTVEVDDGLAAYFEKGKSYTGEIVVELYLHGGRYLLKKVLGELLKTGLCRPALAGEFTFRAVRNGKLSLSQAESVRQLIEAKTGFEIQSARTKLDTSRIQFFDNILIQLHDLLAKVELSIDFVDQDVEVISKVNLLVALEDLLVDLRLKLDQMRLAEKVAAGINITLIGRPNSGKSTLFNALLEEDRAIVSDEPGTTRDLLSEELRLGPYVIKLYDTAGLRISSDKIEKQGIEKARVLIDQVDLNIFILDSTADLTQAIEEFEQIYLRNKDIGGLLVINKIDLLDVTAINKLKTTLEKKIPFKQVLVSAKTKQGITDLLNLVREFLDHKYNLGNDLFLPTEFQNSCLQECLKAISEAVETVRASGLQFPEIISVQLNSAAKALSDMSGQTTPETILTKIFSEFCIGK